MNLLNKIHNHNKIYNKSLISYWKYFLHRILNIYVYKFHYLVLKINYDDLIVKSNDIDIEIRELFLEDFNYGDPAFFNTKKKKVYKKRVQDNNYKAYGVFDNSKLIYSTWISFKNLGLPIPCKIKLNENEALLEDSYCHPDYRGLGLHSKMNLFRLKKIYEQGRTYAIAIVLEGNTAALKVQKKSGFQELGYFYAGKIFGFPFTTLNKKKYDDREKNLF